MKPVPETAHFWNHVPGWFQIYPDPCGFVWTPETLTTTSLVISPTSWATSELLWILFLYSFCGFENSPLINLITNCTLKSISAQFKKVESPRDWMFVYRLDSLFSVENQRLEHLLQRSYSSMRFRSDTVFTETFLRPKKFFCSVPVSNQPCQFMCDPNYLMSFKKKKKKKNNF